MTRDESDKDKGFDPMHLAYVLVYRSTDLALGMLALLYVVAGDSMVASPADLPLHAACRFLSENEGCVVEFLTCQA